MGTKAIEKVIWKATHGVETTSEEDALAYAELEAIRKAARAFDKARKGMASNIDVEEARNQMSAIAKESES